MDAAQDNTKKSDIIINEKISNSVEEMDHNQSEIQERLKENNQDFIDNEVLQANKYIHSLIMTYNNDNSQINLNSMREALKAGISHTDEILNEKMTNLSKKLKKYQKFLSLVNNEYFQLISINEKVSITAEKFKHKCIICDAYTIKKIQTSQHR